MDGDPEQNILLEESIFIDSNDENKGRILILTINRPDKLNALNKSVSTAIKEASSKAMNDDSVRVVIFNGAAPNPPPEGKRSKPNSFVAGADISEFKDKKSEEIFEIFSDNCWEAVWKIDKPTIAMIDGFALGGGCELAMSCDIRIATDRSVFGQPEINLGLIPGGGGTQRLTHLVGYGKSLELILSGKFIDAEEAYSFGLINHLCSPDELRNITIELATTIGSKSIHTLKIAKKAVRMALNSPIDEGIQKELRIFSDLFDTEDKEIGVNAFLEKKSPEWKGR
ncbi:MAG TPA: enoyl-CoA hydratase/isomerase family protein [Candidatus Poseidoniaceae archaeon]|nr:enoyl-CoA hydratase/isomerase family protein [Candidatus Poseidoniaceae archaeon]